jgi:hypothetical protein
MTEIAALATAGFGIVVLGTRFVFRPRFRLEMRGNDLYIAARNANMIRILHEHDANLPIKIEPPVTPFVNMVDLQTQYKYIATFTSKDEPKKSIKDCAAANACTMVEYQTDSLLSSLVFFRQKTLYWKDAKVLE